MRSLRHYSANPIPILLGWLTLSVAVSVGLAPPALAQGYGYRRAEDPLILAVKRAIELTRRGDHAGAARTVASVQWQVEELRTDVRVDLGPALRAATRAHDVRRLAYTLTHLVFQAMRQKFHWNAKERLAKYGRARSRLDAAEFYYTEILSHTVRRADRAQKKSRHEQLLADFRALKHTLGSPGLFGAGSRAPDLEQFRRIAARIEGTLREVYPDFLGARAQRPERPGSRPAGTSRPASGKADGSGPKQEGGG